MTGLLDQLEPKPLWQRFDEIRQIPRPSKHEQRISRYVLDFAASHGCTSRVDPAGNIVVYVPASGGCESAPTVVLQGHLDMVCEKNSDKVFDFANDAIQLVRDGDTLRADGTTLGADNGIGVAAALGVITDASVKHGPLELIFTVEEETGLVGAQGFDSEMISGTTLINLDSEDDGVVTIGCAGGRGTTITLPYSQKPATGATVQIDVAGLSGGHSGIDIHHGRGNAIKLLAELLGALGDLRVVSFTGGSAHNAIPREASAVVVTPAGVDIDNFIDQQQKALSQRFGGTDPGLRLATKICDERATKALPQSSSQALIALLAALPDGVAAMSEHFPNVVETSNTVAILSMGETGAEILCSSRSSSDAALSALGERLQGVAEEHGATAASGDGYPGWSPDPDSRLLALAVAVYSDLFGEPPVVEAIHAGLECGLIGQRKPGMDMISIGPTIRNPHSPAEEVSIGSVSKMLGSYLNGILTALAEAEGSPGAKQG